MTTPPTDMTGRVCIVTGSNTGIGRVTALELARMGAHVLLACRSQERTAPVVEAISMETGNRDVEFLLLDLASMDSIRHATEEFLARDLPLHVLVNNAGLAGARGVTQEGFELTFGVNHLGHFLLTALLLDRLRDSAPSRIVNVASTAHYRAKGIDLKAVLGPRTSRLGLPEYSESKLANVLFSAELSRRLEGSGVTTYALHPGVIASDIWRRLPWPIRPLMTLFMISNEEGARTTLRCATDPELASESGLYYDDNGLPKEPSRVARDLTLAADLWHRSEEWCSDHLGVM